MSRGFGKHMLLIAAGLAAVAVTSPGMAYASTLSMHVKALPNPPGAPQRDLFLVTFLHGHHPIPVTAEFHLVTSNGKRVHASAALRRLNSYQYETAWSVPERGQLTLDVYAAHQTLLASETYPVAKAKPNVVGRVVVGALFIGASLYFWWRNQRFYRRDR